ncbi:MAG: alpha/beta hydrolase [Pseudonocardiaceae bacterium]
MPMVVANGVKHYMQQLQAKGHNSDGPAPIVVLMHGLLIDSLASYSFTLGPRFAAAGLDVIMYDLRGHGRSTRPGTGYRLADFLDDLDDLLVGMEIRTPVHLVGNSLGGTIAFGYAERRPERVASVVLVESIPAARGWEPKMLFASDLARLVLGDSAPANSEWETRAAMASDLAHVGDHFSRPENIAEIADSHGLPAARLAKRMGQMLWSTSIIEDLLASEVLSCTQIAAVSVPTMAIYGAESELVREAVWLKSVLPSCATVIVPGEGHYVLFNRVVLMEELILEWLRGHGVLTGALIEARPE